MRRTIPSTASAVPSNTPDRIASSVRRPMVRDGGVRSVAGSLAVPRMSASDAVRIPGMITPPRKWPSAVMQSNVVAVPKSTTMVSRRCSCAAASVLRMRSAPTCSGSSTSSVIGKRDRPSTTTGRTVVARSTASHSPCVTGGTTDATTAAPMPITPAAYSGVVTIAILSRLFRLAPKPVPALPDASLLVRYGTWMIVAGVACGVLMPLALVTVAVTAGFRNAEDPYYFGGMLLFFALLGWWALLEGLKRRVVATDSGLVAHSPWRGEPVRFAWAQVARITFSPVAGQLVFADRAGEKIRVGTMMSGLDQL